MNNEAQERMAEALQGFWQGPSGRSWNNEGDNKSCCVALPGQADWFRALADVALAVVAVATSQCDEGDHIAGSDSDKCFSCFIFNEERPW